MLKQAQTFSWNPFNTRAWNYWTLMCLHLCDLATNQTLLGLYSFCTPAFNILLAMRNVISLTYVFKHSNLTIKLLPNWYLANLCGVLFKDLCIRLSTCWYLRTNLRVPVGNCQIGVELICYDCQAEEYTLKMVFFRNRLKAFACSLQWCFKFVVLLHCVVLCAKIFGSVKLV